MRSVEGEIVVEDLGPGELLERLQQMDSRVIIAEEQIEVHRNYDEEGRLVKSHAEAGAYYNRIRRILNALGPHIDWMEESEDVQYRVLQLDRLGYELELVKYYGEGEWRLMPHDRRKGWEGDAVISGPYLARHDELKFGGYE